MVQSPKKAYLIQPLAMTLDTSISTHKKGLKLLQVGWEWQCVKLSQNLIGFMQPETAATMGTFGDEAWHIAVAKQGYWH
jgi:hypothetical protein